MDDAQTLMPEEADGLPPRERRMALVTVSIAIAMAVLDGAIANIALPQIARELHTAPADSIWVVNAYQLAVVMTLLPLAAMGDVIGYRRVYMFGLSLFTVASLCCGLAYDMPLLIAARVLQGLGAAGIMSVNSALIRFAFPRAQLGRGVGISALVVATSSAAGPTVAAAILSVASWHWLYLMNIPLGIVAVALARRSLPYTPLSGARYDWLSAVLSAASFGLLLTGLDGFGHDEAHLFVATEFALGAIAAFVFIRRQNRLASPLLPVDLFRKPIFSLSVATSICSYAAQTIAYVTLPFYFAVGGDMSQARIGLLITPWPAVVVIIAPIAGRLSDRYPAGLLGGIGLAVLTGGLITLNLLPADPSFADAVWRMMIAGIGFGFFQSPNNRTLIASAPRHRSGVASGVLSTARLTGQTLGGVTVAVIFGLMAGHIGQEAHAALTVAAAFSGVACVISFLRLRA
jgi:DHA2 family multidrug resistance protein-like MFS transporter